MPGAAKTDGAEPRSTPRVMVALLLYCYSGGERSSRKIERRCKEDVACRFITANHTPDHSTIARFRQSHEQELNGLFTEALRLCAEAGLVKVGLVALDSTKVEANASSWVNRTEDQIDKEVAKILDEAAQTDAEEDRAFGKDRRGDELPDDLADRNSRLARLKEAKAALQEDFAERQRAYEVRLAERAAEEAERGSKHHGRKPKPPDPSDLKERKVNVTDPDSRVMKTPSGYIQGYNAQAVANENQIVLAAEVVSEHNDYNQLHPMIDALNHNLQDVGVTQKVCTLVADSGYLSDDNLLAADDDTPGPAHRRSQRPRPTHGQESSERAHPEELVTHETDGAQACDQTRTEALPKTRSDGRAGVRPSQDQGVRAIHAARTDRVRQRVEAREHDPQPPQAVAIGREWTIRSSSEVTPSHPEPSSSDRSSAHPQIVPL